MAEIELPGVSFVDGQELCAEDLNAAFTQLSQWVCDNFTEVITIDSNGAVLVDGSTPMTGCLIIPESCGTGSGEAVSGAFLAACKTQLQDQITANMQEIADCKAELMGLIEDLTERVEALEDAQP